MERLSRWARLDRTSVSICKDFAFSRSYLIKIHRRTARTLLRSSFKEYAVYEYGVCPCINYMSFEFERWISTN